MAIKSYFRLVASFHCLRLPLNTLFRASLAILLVTGAAAANAQQIENRPVVVEAEAGELPTAYAAPPDLSHARISTLTKPHMLSPFTFEPAPGDQPAAFLHALPTP